ncbi:hypothetical protein Ahy_B10g100540 [Arachis hypogaea]|uniref:Uncharacterized protein n=1 Tax=Arachis hypogaea TaxID=3818 RepID=A0A444WX21_ARAHY|nr:hypothetical protein Ahy_B10g100540 [Arachis hypogaea]
MIMWDYGKHLSASCCIEKRKVGVYLHDPTAFLAAVDPTLVTWLEVVLDIKPVALHEVLQYCTTNRKEYEILKTVYLRFWEMDPSDSDFFGSDSNVGFPRGDDPDFLDDDSEADEDRP